MAKSKACGFLLTRESSPGHIEYLLLTNRERQEAGFPKGHVEDGESELESALRETAEETGLAELAVHPHFRFEMRYPAARKGKVHDKTVVYFAAHLLGGEVVLSEEHSHFEWLPLADAVAAIPFANLKAALLEHARFHKHRDLFALQPWTVEAADAWLAALPHADERLLGHLRGGAAIARHLAEALREHRVAVDPEATEIGTLLHDAGRGLGEHADHQRAGLHALREAGHGAHGFACISHFAKGAQPDELVAAGLSQELVDSFCGLIEMRTMTWEERCAALADACMRGTEAVHPKERFADLRARYDAPRLIDLQEARTRAIRADFEAELDEDPLELLGL